MKGECIMKTAIIAVALATICSVPAIAADTTTGGKGQGMTVEQKKAEILQHIQERITNSQAEMTCVKAATSHDQLMACREKYRPQRQQPGNERRNQNQ